MFIDILDILLKHRIHDIDGSIPRYIFEKKTFKLDF